MINRLERLRTDGCVYLQVTIYCGFGIYDQLRLRYLHTCNSKRGGAVLSPSELCSFPSSTDHRRGQRHPATPLVPRLPHRAEAGGSESVSATFWTRASELLSAEPRAPHSLVVIAKTGSGGHA